MNTQKLKAAALSIIALYLSPLFIFGEDSLVPIHDNLDVTHLFFKILAESGLIFGGNNAQVHNIFNGVPRGILGSEFNVQLWLFYLFGSYSAFAINKAIVHFVAFFGMSRLLTRHFISRENEFLAIGVALAFALLPFYTPLGLSVAGLAFSLDAFLTIRNGKGKTVDWLVVIFMPFYSSLAHVYIFFLFLMSFLWLYDFKSKENANPKFLGSIALMALIFMGVEYRNIFMVFYNSDFTSYREEFKPLRTSSSTLYGLHEAIISALKTFAFGKVYSQSLQTFFILPAFIIGTFIVIDRNIKERKLWILFSLITLICIFNGIMQSDIIWPLMEKYPFFKVYRVHRAYYFYPLLWSLIFAISLNIILSHANQGKKAVCIFIFLQIIYTFYYHDEIQQRNGKPSYRAFYAKKLFSEISDYIAKDTGSFRVVSIGIHPSIAAYNGFYTLDGYSSLYPLKHKHNFRKIIAKELEKNKKIRLYFDNFGGRCYVFVEELVFADWLYNKTRKMVIHNLELNIEPFVEMGGEYIFSALEIKNYKENSLEFLKAFDHPESAWKIYLYRPVVIAKPNKINLNISHG